MLLSVNKNSTWILPLWFLIVTFGAGGAQRESPAAERGIRGSITLNQVLSWLPLDTESVLVANGPFWMSNFRLAENGSTDGRVTIGELDKRFEGMVLALFNTHQDILEKHLEGEKVSFAMEASRHFRSPKGLGEAPFQGCALAIFKDDIRDRREAFMRDSAPTALRVEEIEGHKVAIFREQLEQDVWTTLVTFPQPGVVLVATDEHFLRQVLSRMHDEEGQTGRALPDTLPEWKYVQQDAKFWGLRHYDHQQAYNDPTSPFGGRKAANIADDNAIGLTYESNPAMARKATLTYLTGTGVDLGEIEKKRFPAASDAEGIADLHIQYEQLAPGIMRSTYKLDHTKPTEFFFFVLMGNMGHAIYL